jgi:UDP-N-acetylglucosamine acyltransferase
MGSVITKDVPPFVLVGGHPAEPRGINVEGMRRRGIDDATIQCVKNAYRRLYMSGSKLEEAAAAMRALPCNEACLMADFVAQNARSIVR